ncbi:CoB--CoM heterodisulfide reductase iron-sulfur subunit B family protein [Ectothiorhodospira lacustris]|uniref:CoB--CoM heterodisulfide reductase iron-sulfur subunit B family protein n=1 Tax=Ectothiorhodospira lacustris TaxID=2899127 RepID=UPI001EE7CBEF|nr:CoB--CoM heterodisulfide reductase iron-sulfur subunit B family protein [Ectothiorhodospira lacustris]MCG5499571.1 CoB--CoM heterodisulfide reductase iron-sulfur subunit B family protein [Ectothiorhodospira lacustris]MCG5508735.1 CoB--CoM heterodisulfide reductase iron-sulfur subunit B family protein [Ectothiorhodospira lacustris]MCG5520526.1 CoB--CoM heterodisulfide reductase iron-sulfur subunit B family protein [Ectothiorhodospira lacustris]
MAKAKVAYYPGCALEGSAGPYDKSTRVLVKALDMEMVNLKDYNCCGAMEVKNIHPMLQTYLSARNLAIATEQMGLNTVMAPCNGCYHNLKKAEYETATSEKTMETVQDLARKAGDPVYKGDVRTVHLLEWLMEEKGPEGIKDRMKKSLNGIRIANYYGCMYTRPRQIFPEKDQGPGSESTYKPHFMDDLLEAVGGANMDFPLKTACCGGAHTLSDSDTSTQLVLNLLQAAEDSGAEVIATECPTCHSGLEMHQVRAETEFGIKTHVKIVYFTQLLGLSMGLSPRKLGIHENVSDSIGFLKDKGVI